MLLRIGAKVIDPACDLLAEKGLSSLFFVLFGVEYIEFSRPFLLDAAFMDSILSHHFFEVCLKTAPCLLLILQSIAQLIPLLSLFLLGV